MADFNMKILDDFDFTVEERGNSYTAIRKITWKDGGTPRIDIRRYSINSEGDEVIGKGIGFLTEEGPSELVTILTDNGFGDTESILNSIKNRVDFKSSLGRILDNEDLEKFDIDSVEEDEEVFYDARELV